MLHFSAFASLSHSLNLELSLEGEHPALKFLNDHIGFANAISQADDNLSRF